MASFKSILDILLKQLEVLYPGYLVYCHLHFYTIPKAWYFEVVPLVLKPGYLSSPNSPPNLQTVQNTIILKAS